MSDVVCEVCGMGTARHETTNEPLEYRGQTKEFALHGHVCDVCHTEYATAEDMRLNKRIKVAFEKEVDGLLSGREVKAIRERLGVTQAQAGTLFGGGPVAFCKYENDELAQSAPMDNVLRIVNAVPEAWSFLVSRCSDPVVREKVLGANVASQAPVHWIKPTTVSSIAVAQAMAARVGERLERSHLSHPPLHPVVTTLLLEPTSTFAARPEPKARRYSLSGHTRGRAWCEIREELGGDEPGWEHGQDNHGVSWTDAVTVVDELRTTH